MRRLKPVKDLTALILAPRRHDRQLWADLLKNCGINNPLSISDIEHATSAIGSGHADVVFVDEAYGPKDIANVLIPARNVEFAGGRGVCLILCSKKATAQDVINARKLGFASLVILPASIDTVRKHLELAARFIPLSDEELGWSAPNQKEANLQKAMPSAKDDPASSAVPGSLGAHRMANADGYSADLQNGGMLPEDDTLSLSEPMRVDSPHQQTTGADQVPHAAESAQNESTTHPANTDNRDATNDSASPKAPGRSGNNNQDEVVFL